MDLEIASPVQPFPVGVAGGLPAEKVHSYIGHALLATAVLFVIGRALPILTFPLGGDQGGYLMIGQGLLQGKILYRDLADAKPPGIFIAYAGIAKLFGSVMWSAAAVDILLLLVISYGLFRFTERHLGRAGAAVAIMINASMHGNMQYFWIAQPETFQVACVLTAYLLMMRQGRGARVGWVFAGLLFGYGCWLKYNAVAFLPFLLFLPFVDTGRLVGSWRRVSLTISWRAWFARAGLLLAGLAAASGVVLTWIVSSGAWPAMKEVQFQFVPRYAAMAVQRRPHYFLSVLDRTNLYLGVWNLSALLAAILVARMRQDLKRFVVPFLAALTSYVAVAMQLRFHDYYFQTCFPFFAVIWAYLAINIYEGFSGLAKKFSQHGWRLAAGLIWIVFALTVYWPLPQEFSNLMIRYEELREWRADSRRFYANYPDQLPFEYLGAELQVVDYLRKNAQPCDGLYVWGTRGVIYYLTGHIPPTRFHANLGLMSPWCPHSWRQELMRDLRAAKPRFIIVARHDALPIITYVNLDSETFLKRFPELDTFITQNYKPAGDFEHFVVYCRQ